MYVVQTVCMTTGRRGDVATKAPKSAAVAARAVETRAALVDTARRLFTEKGYFATKTEEIVAEAGVGTRGALYHHFEDKRALFLAVFEQVEDDLLAGSAGLEIAGSAVDLLRAASRQFIESSMAAHVQRILLIEGPAVLGWEQWRKLEESYGLGALRGLLEAIAAEGHLRADLVDVLAHMFLASLDEAALFIAHSDDQEAARDQAIAGIEQLINGLTASRD